MESISQSPFFPVPVQWFELPMDTARWGFVRQQQSAVSVPSAVSPYSGGTTSEPASVQPSAPDVAVESRSVGRILDELA